MAKASELPEQSAGPFDAACMLVRHMEQELEELPRLRALRYAVDAMMSHLGMVGEINTPHPTVDAVMTALHDIDNGGTQA